MTCSNYAPVSNGPLPPLHAPWHTSPPCQAHIHGGRGSLGTLQRLLPCRLAARGHFELLQLVLETAVMIEGPEKAKRYAIDHANSKKQTALMVACKHG